MNQVLDFVGEKTVSDEGATVLVFTDGWKHNPSAKDSNVVSFKRLLENVARLQQQAAELERRRPGTRQAGQRGRRPEGHEQKPLPW